MYSSGVGNVGGAVIAMVACFCGTVVVVVAACDFWFLWFLPFRSITKFLDLAWTYYPRVSLS